MSKRDDLGALSRALALASPVFERLEERSASLARDLARAEIGSSLRLAGRYFARDEITAMAERGIAPHGRALADCNALADYAAASDYVARLSRTGRRRAWIETREIVALHALATQRSLGSRPGLWRSGMPPSRDDGVVAPAPWAISREIERFVERFAAGPPTAPEALASWLADAASAFDRIAPFEDANGRVGRLILGVLLRRLRLPPLVVRTAAEIARYRDAFRIAAGGELGPLARAFASMLLRSVDETPVELLDLHDLAPFAELAPASERAALYKAAERGRLRTIRRGRAILCSPRWLDEYRRSRAPAGRRAKRGATAASTSGSAEM